MKEMQKARILVKKSVNSVMNERKILTQLRHPLIVNIQCAFQDNDNLYLAMDFLPGGDLRFHLGKMRRFSEAQTKFFVACILTGLEYVHQKGFIHRDVKPENIVLDQRGYAKITDFGIARPWTAENSQDTSGTPGYMAPEVMCRQCHTPSVDFYALGIIVYEFMTGHRPYAGKNRKEIRDNILARQVQLTRSVIPEGWTLEAADFANRLIQRKPCNRLGLNGANDLKNHVWMKGFNWQLLYDGLLQSPFIPPNIENFADKKRFDHDPWITANMESLKKCSQMLKQPSTQNMF